MSNAEIANLYKHVIDEVISDSRQDFEAKGIDEGTLQDLKAIWIEKLAHTNVANFGWMAEQNEPMMAAPGNMAHLGMVDTSQTTGFLDPVKAEPLDGSMRLSYPVPSDLNHSVHLPRDRDSGGLVLPGAGGKIEQSDGAILVETLVQNNEPVEVKELAVEESKLKELNKDQIQNFTFEVEVPRSYAKKFIHNISQNDGPNDSDSDPFKDLDDDQNANESDQINSDLDDSEEDLGSGDENDRSNDNYIFCLYDKVQRVKNKWKFNLKDGIASINGKDYGFSKATGESDW